MASELDIVLGLGFLLTVHNADWDPRDGHHLAAGVAPVLKHGPDHLLWAIADDLVDGYFPFADQIGDAIDEIQDEVVRKATPDTVERLFKLKRELIQVRRAISPIREVFNQLTNRDENLIDPDELVYYRDIYDHVIRLTDELDNYRELASATLDVYLTQVNNNLSVIMKRLTGVTVILAGIGAVAGIFGMSEAGSALDGGEAPGFWAITGSPSRRPLAPRSCCAGSTGSDGLAGRNGRQAVFSVAVPASPSIAVAMAASARPTSTGESRSTSAAARTSSGIPCGPVTATARPATSTRVARRPQHGEPVGVAAVVAEGHDGCRPQVCQQALERLALAAGGPRTEIDDQPAAVVGQLVLGQLAVDGFDGGDDRGASRGTVVGLADVEGHRWSLALDEEPGRPSQDLGNARRRGSRPAGRTPRGRHGTSSRGGPGGRAGANDPDLQAVVSEVAGCRRRGRAPRHRPPSGRSGSRRSPDPAARRRRVRASAARAGRAAR